jgi:hypothetical protein
MATTLLDTKRVTVVTPQSDSNIIFEDYEFLLTWYNREGGQVQWMFNDWENAQRPSGNPVNIEDADRIRTLTEREQRSVKLIAEDITREEGILFESLLIAKTIYRVFRIDSQLYEPGGFQRYAILNGRRRWIQSKQRFRVELELQEIEPTLWR